MKMKIIKKNQLAILVIALMLITAGYLNYDTNNNKSQNLGASSELQETLNLASIGDAELVNSDVIDEPLQEEIQASTETNNPNNYQEPERKETSSVSDEYFVKSKLERNVMYSQMISRYQETISSNSQAADQKAVAQQEINKINELQNAIMIAENLLASKGFDRNIIFVNGASINVIIGKESLEADEIAQVQNIISRELTAELDNIHISMK